MPGLDLARLAAALMVMAMHYLWEGTAKDRHSLAFGAIFQYGPGVGRYSALGALGVDLFFIISGFVIAISAQGRSPGAFIRARLLRIVPLFWVCCCITSGAILLDPTYRTLSLAQWVANLFFVARPLGFEFIDAVYWSLVVEMRFYAMVALLMAMGWFGRMERCLAVWLALGALDLVGGVPGPLRFLLLPQYAEGFVIGGGLYLLCRSAKPHARAWGRALVAGGLVVAAIRAHRHLEAVSPGLGGPAVVLYVLAVWALWCLVSGRWRVPAAPWVAALGALTYPLYLLHEDLGFLYLRHATWTADPLGLTASAALLFLVASHVIARWVDVPLRRWLGSRCTTGLPSINRPQRA